MNNKKIILIGYMGSGKTAVGMLVGQKVKEKLPDDVRDELDKKGYEIIKGVLKKKLKIK